MMCINHRKIGMQRSYKKLLGKHWIHSKKGSFGKPAIDTYININNSPVGKQKRKMNAKELYTNCTGKILNRISDVLCKGSMEKP